MLPDPVPSHASAPLADYSSAARAFALAAVSGRTRATYCAPLRHFRAWCAARNLSSDAASITARVAASWIADVAGEGTRMARTLGTWRSALSTYWVEALLDGGNPTHSTAFDRVMKGIKASRAQTDIDKRRSTPQTAQLTFALLAEMASVGRWDRGGSRENLLCWAAACVGAYGLLRPNEFLYAHKAERPALRPEAVTFYAAVGSARVSPLLPPGSDVDQHAWPEAVALDLGITKADRMGRNPPLRITVPLAVRALWRWIHLRRDLGATRPELFSLPHASAPLSCAALCRFVADGIAAVTGCDPPHVTGRTFRRGGAESMMVAGASRPEIMAAGRWLSDSMPALYAGRSATIESALLSSRASAAAASASVPVARRC